MIDIADYILKPKQERQQHLDLDLPCDERGGMSAYFKGLLAYHCDTSIPSGHIAQVCHACHNGKCSNVRHLYWGTPSENAEDARANGKPNIWEAQVAKYGYKEACRRNSRSKDQASKAGKASAAVPRDPARYKKTAETLTGTRRANNGEVNIVLKHGEELPVGFSYGMTPRKRKNKPKTI